jgi:hypothetical protein
MDDEGDPGKIARVLQITKTINLSIDYSSQKNQEILDEQNKPISFWTKSCTNANQSSKSINGSSYTVSISASSSVISLIEENFQRLITIIIILTITIMINKLKKKQIKI